MKTDQIHVIARTMLGDLQQIDDAQETGFDCQLVSNVEECDLFNGIDLDFTFLHAVTAAGLDVRILPDSNAAGDGPAADALAKTLGKNHCQMKVSLSSYCTNHRRIIPLR